MSKADKTRQLIIEKVAPLFNRQGYAGTSIHDIMTITGLSKGCIYGNFADKDEIAVEAFDYNWRSVSQAVSQTWQQQATAMAQLQAFANFYRNSYEAVFANGGCPVLNTAIEADDTHALLQEKVKQAMGSVIERLETSIVAGIERGELKPDTNARKYAGILFALIEGGILLAKTTGQADFLHHAIDQYEMIIHGLLADNVTQTDSKMTD